VNIFYFEENRDNNFQLSWLRGVNVYFIYVFFFKNSSIQSPIVTKIVDLLRFWSVNTNVILQTFRTVGHELSLTPNIANISMFLSVLRPFLFEKVQKRSVTVKKLMLQRLVTLIFTWKMFSVHSRSRFKIERTTV
jgi:hypothetical protein